MAGQLGKENAEEIAKEVLSFDWKRLSAGDGTKGPRRHDWCYLELADLDADIEGQQRGQQMRSGELQRFPQGKRETKSVYQAEAKGHHPAAL